MTKILNDTEKKIIELYNAGWRTRLIGIEVGKTKNSVCGLLSRLREKGFLGPTSKKDKPDQRKERPKRVLGNKPDPNKMRHFKELSLKAKIEDLQLPLNLPNMNGISFAKLKNKSCRYIISGGNGRPHMYCGEPKEHKSYCLYHAGICYLKPEERTRMFEKRK